MDPHLYNTVVNLYVKRKMQNKNAEVLNNTSEQQCNNSPIVSAAAAAAAVVELQLQDPVAPPLPPRTVPIDQSFLADISGAGDISLPGAPPLHTHSSKFPIEREVVVKTNGEKHCKIPNISEYMRRAKTSVAPDAPPKQIAWAQQNNNNNKQEDPDVLTQECGAHQIYKAQPMSILESEPSPIRPQNSQEVATSTPESEGAKGLPQKTYQSIKDMISSRFSKQTHPNQPSSSPQANSQLANQANYNLSNGTNSQQNIGDTTLSPQSQLRQHGVYLANSTPQVELMGMRPPQMKYEPRHQFHTPQVNYKFQTPHQYPNPQVYHGIVETPVWKSYDANHIQATWNGREVQGYNVDPAQYDPEKGGPRYQPPPTHLRAPGPPPTQQYRNLNRPYPSTSRGYPHIEHMQQPHPHQTPKFSQGAVTVHAPPESLEVGIEREQSNQRQENSKPAIKANEPDPAKKEEDDEGGFAKRGVQSDSGRGSTVYSSAKNSAEDTTPPITGGEVAEWSERVDTELRQIFGATKNPGDEERAEQGVPGSSESFSSVSPPLPPLSPRSSDDTYRRPRLGNGYSGKIGSQWRQKEKSRSHKSKSSTLEIDSMLDEINTSDDELDYADARAIRKQLEGLEAMYGQVLKMLGVKNKNGKYEASDPRINKRRSCGSVSSAPSSLSGRIIRQTDRRGVHRSGKIRDVKGINKRFQRLESHVVTLARSVAHLSSEMRTQHIMMQEMEMMRGELASLRIQSNAQQQATNHIMNATQTPHGLNTSKACNNSTPEKVKRLTKFFGDEPPLLRLFLRRLGYEKYAGTFEKEKIGLLELPFLTEERLHKLGIPLGPRLRILQQAHLASPNTLCVL